MNRAIHLGVMFCNIQYTGDEQQQFSFASIPYILGSTGKI